MKFKKQILLSLLGVALVGCGVLGERCNEEDEKLLREAATTKMENGIIIPGYGIQFRGGKFLSFDDPEIAQYGAVKKSINAKAMRYVNEIGASIPEKGRDLMRDDGLKDADIEMADDGYKMHRAEIIDFYFCANRLSEQWCKKKYGLDLSNKSVQRWVSEQSKRALEDWEAKIVVPHLE